MKNLIKMVIDCEDYSANYDSYDACASGKYDYK